MSDNNVAINLEVATKAAEIALARLKKQTDENTKSFDIFKGIFAGNLAASGINKAFDVIKGQFSRFIDEASQAEQAIKNMEVALASAGLLTPQVSKAFQELGDTVEATTRFNSDQVASSVALLASLTNLSDDGIKKATSAAIDLAATLNLDLATASEMISKAVNGNLLGFSKLGISIEKGSTDAERLTNVLAALSSQQGAATAQAETYAGASEINANAQGKLYEAIGKIITTNPTFIKTLQSSAEVLITVANWVEKNSKDIVLLAQSMLAGAAIYGTGVAIMNVATLGLAGSFSILSAAATTAWAVVSAPITLVVAAIGAIGVAIYSVVKYWDNLKAIAADTVAEILELGSVATGMFNQDLAASIQKQSDQYRNQANAIRETIKAKEDEANANSAGALALAEKEKQEKQQEKIRKDRLAEEAKDNARLAQEKLNIEKKFTADLMLTKQERTLALEEIEAQHQTNMQTIAGENEMSVLERQISNQAEALTLRQAHEQAMLQTTIDAELAKANIIKDNDERQKAITAANNKAALDKLKLQTKQEIETKKQSLKADEEVERLKVSNRKDTFSTIATLSESSNKELAAVGKAFALYQIGVDTAQGVTKALGSAPPPFNFALAALVGAAGAVQASKVAGLNFAKGGIVPNKGGIVSGTSYQGDKLSANVNSREMWLNVPQQKRLFDIADGKQSPSSSDSGSMNMMKELIYTLKNQVISVEIDGKSVFTAVRAQLDSGRGFA